MLYPSTAGEGTTFVIEGSILLFTKGNYVLFSNSELKFLALKISYGND